MEERDLKVRPLPDESLLGLLRNEREGDEGGYQGDDGGEGNENGDGRHIQYIDAVKPRLWTVLAAASVLNGRRVLTTGFPYPICFVVLLQLTACLPVAITISIIRLRDFSCHLKSVAPWLRCDLGTLKRKCSMGEKYSEYEKLVLATRLCAVFLISAGILVCGAKSLAAYRNLSVLAMLPVSTFVTDRLIMRLLHTSGAIQNEQSPSRKTLVRVVLVFVCVSVALYEDYRLNVDGLLFALAAICLSSLLKCIPRIGPTIENGSVHTWDCVFYRFLMFNIPLLLFTSYAAFQLEDVGTAFYVGKSWDHWGLLFALAPGALHHIIFNGFMNTAYPISPRGNVDSALEDSDTQAITAVKTTLQAGFLVVLIEIFGTERNLTDFIQIATFTILYIVIVGPKSIVLYLPRLKNLTRRILRMPQQQIVAEAWQTPLSLFVATTFFAALVSLPVSYGLDTFAYNQDVKTWLDPINPHLDVNYHPPKEGLLEIVIAHSRGDPTDSISKLIAEFTTLPVMEQLQPRVKIYTKDKLMNSTNFANLSGSFKGQLSAQMLENSGGVTATYLHHILDSWEYLSPQTLFLSTSSPLRSSLAGSRFRDYFMPAVPVDGASPRSPSTGFLNLGDQQVCHCDKCFDNTGWSDTFHLVHSMWGAARPGSQPCASVLLTYGNSFVASADRIRGVGRDVYQVLYEALTNGDLDHAWAHDERRLPKRGIMITEKEDTIENPYLGLTIERLWGVLMQCSTPEIAWSCPNVFRGWRRGGKVTDCGCQ